MYAVRAIKFASAVCFKKDRKEAKASPLYVRWLQDNLLPRVLTLLAEDVAAVHQLDNLQVALLLGDFLGGELTHIGREVHELTLTSVVGENAGTEGLTCFILEGADLHLAILTGEGHQGPTLLDTFHNSLSSHSTILPFIR